MDRQDVSRVQIIRGNALALPLADDSVDLVVTSPPYFGLRSYQDGGEHYSGQIGDEPTPAEFVDALIAATAEMVRVVKPSGSIWVNLGDKYAGTPVRSGDTVATSRVIVAIVASRSLGQHPRLMCMASPTNPSSASRGATPSAASTTSG